MNIQKLLEIYLNICKNPREAYKYFGEIFGPRADLPVTWELGEFGESQVQKIDWVRANKMVEDEVVKLISEKFEKKD